MVSTIPNTSHQSTGPGGFAPLCALSLTTSSNILGFPVLYIKSTSSKFHQNQKDELDAEIYNAPPATAT